MVITLLAITALVLLAVASNQHNKQIEDLQELYEIERRNGARWKLKYSKNALLKYAEKGHL